MERKWEDTEKWRNSEEIEMGKREGNGKGIARGKLGRNRER